MEVNNLNSTSQSSKGMWWTAKILTWLCIIFLLVDAIMKVLKATPSMEGSVKLGWPADSVQAIGIVLLLCTILYMIPRTAVLGAILITGYLGGATSIMVRAGEPFFFPVIFSVMVWAGLFLHDSKLRGLIPFKKGEM